MDKSSCLTSFVQCDTRQSGTQMMNVEGLTRENVASHLQKFRLQLKRENRLDDDGNLISPLKVRIIANLSVHGLSLCIGCMFIHCRVALLNGHVLKVF